jgi:glucokinase
MSGPRFVLGLDFGGTKLAAGIVDLLTGSLMVAQHVPTDPEAGAEGAFEAVLALVNAINAPGGAARFDAIGISFGGHVRAGEILRSLHVPGWGDFPLRACLREHFGPLEVRIANDANAAAIGEWRFGAGRHLARTGPLRRRDSLLYVTVSTGIGGGLVLDGQMYEGTGGMAGEIGHTVTMPGGPECPCGRRGCLEAVASGSAIARAGREALGNPVLTASDVNLLALSGDMRAIRVMQEAGSHLGRALANAVSLFDAAVVVVGGGVSRACAPWWDAVNAAFHANVFAWNDGTELVRAALGPDVGIWGAAALFS